MLSSVKKETDENKNPYIDSDIDSGYTAMYYEYRNGLLIGAVGVNLFGKRFFVSCLNIGIILFFQFIRLFLFDTFETSILKIESSSAGTEKRTAPSGVDTEKEDYFPVILQNIRCRILSQRRGVNKLGYKRIERLLVRPVLLIQ